MWEIAKSSVVDPYIKKIDKKLEEMLDEFDNYDYTYKPLLTQSEFEEEFLGLIKNVFRRRDKYNIICTIFNTMVMNSLNDLHKLLCLIDFTINISRYHPTGFKNLPNDIVSSLAEMEIFENLRAYIFNKGRMNYHFNNVLKSSKSKKRGTDDDDVDDVSYNDTQVNKNIIDEVNVSLFNSDVDMNSDSDSSSSDSDSRTSKKVMDVSLAELTRKIMNKANTKTKVSQSTKKDPTDVDFEYIKKEESDDDYDAVLDKIMHDAENNTSEDSDEPNSDNSLSKVDESFITGKNKNIKLRGNIQSKLNSLVESDASDASVYSTAEESADSSSSDEDAYNIHEKGEKELVKMSVMTNDRENISSPSRQRLVIPVMDKSNNKPTFTVPGYQNRSSRNTMHDFDDDIDMTMNNATSIMEHIIEFRQFEKSEPTVRTAKTGRIHDKEPQNYKTNKLIKISKPKSRTAPHHRPQKKQKIAKPELPKNPQKPQKPQKPLSPVKRKTYYVVEQNLDFLFAEMERQLPLSKSILTKKEMKGFIYKPAQYSLLSNINTEGVEADIGQYADNLLNTFILQTAKRCGGNDIDDFQYVHPFEYNYIMDNLENIKNEAMKLPPLIFYDRFSSLFNYEGSVNYNINLLRIKNTKVKGLLKLNVFKSEEEYFEQFKKIVPRDKVTKRLKFLNNLVTDGKNLFVFDAMDEILDEMKLFPGLLFDSEVEEARLMAEYMNEEEKARQKALEKEVEKEVEKEAPKEGERECNNAGAIATQLTELLHKDQTEKTISTATGVEISNETMKPSTVYIRDTEEGNGAVITETDNKGQENTEKENVKDMVTHKDETGKNGELSVVDESNDLEFASYKSEKNATTSNNTEKVEIATGSTEEPSSETKKHVIDLGLTSFDESTKFAIESNSDKMQIGNDGNKLSTLEKKEQAGKLISDVDDATDNEPTIIENTVTKEVKDDSLMKELFEESNELDSAAKNQEQKASDETDTGSLNNNMKENTTIFTKADSYGIFDERDTVYCSIKGVKVPSRTIKKVLSTQQHFELLASLLFPKLKIDSNFEGIPITCLKSMSYAYDGFRPYLMALFLSDVFEFLRLPKYFKVDATMFELQVQDLLKTVNPNSKMKAFAFHGA